MLAWTLMASLFHPPHLPAISAHCAISLMLHVPSGSAWAYKVACNAPDITAVTKFNIVSTTSKLRVARVPSLSSNSPPHLHFAPCMRHSLPTLRSPAPGSQARSRSFTKMQSDSVDVITSAMECRALTFLCSSVGNLPKPASKCEKKRKILSRAAGATQEPSTGRASPVQY